MIEVADGRPETIASIERAEAWMFEHLPRLRRADPTAIYNVWGHGYAIQALVRMYQRHAGDAAKQHEILELLLTQYDYLDRYESVDGGWGYYDFRVGARKPATDSTSFVSAAVLVAFHEASEIGATPPERLTRRAIASIHRQQKPDFSYLYGEYMRFQPMREINRPAGSLGRSQACNVALRLWGDEQITDQVLETWLHRLFARNGWLDIGRKRPIPHEAWFQIAGYFYYFGQYYAALCIEQLPSENRPEFQAHLAHTLIELQETDGSWWDYPLYNYHQQYGTAFALMSLQRCQDGTLNAVARYRAIEAWNREGEAPGASPSRIALPIPDTEGMRSFIFSGERLDPTLVGRQIRTAEQVDAVGDGREDGVQALADRPRLAGQIDDQTGPSNPRRLP
jgi:hypothetical protein